MNGIQLQRISKYRRADLDDEETSSNLSVPADASVASAERCLPPQVHYTSTKPHKRTFWERASPLEKLLLVTSGVLLLLVCILSIVLDQVTRCPALPPVTKEVSSIRTKVKPVPSAKDVCLTPDCVTVAGAVLTSMDLSADPCQDFYQYSCGGWIKANPFPDGKSIWGTFGKLWQENQQVMKQVLESEPDPKAPQSTAEHKARLYYTSCLDKNETMDELGPRPLLELLNKLGGWSILNSTGKGASLSKEDWDFQTTLELAHNVYNRGGAFFSWAVGQDDRNSSQHIIELEQGGLGLPSRDYYLNVSHHPQVLPAYLSYMTKVGVLLGGDENITRQQMQDVIEFETRLAEITIPGEDMRDEEKLYNKMPLSVLQERAPFLNWKHYFNSAFKQINRSIPDSQPVVVFQPEFLANLSLIVTEYLATSEGRGILNTYLGWSVVQSLTSCLSKPFREASKVLRKTLLGTDTGESTWRYCVTDTNNVIGFALGAMFTREVFNTSSKATAEKMINEVREAFVNNFPQLAWMDPQTRAAAKEKAKAITDMIGFPDFITNKEKLDKRYEQLHFEPDQYFANNIHYSQFALVRNMKKLDKPVDRKEWEMSPPTVNAYYTPNKNQIVFPAGILQAPFYDPKYPKSLNFGAMGVVMGHELTHAFDDQGREYDKDGNLNQWWKNSTIQSFTNRTHCFVEQYSNYTINGEHLNGKQTLGENIADNGGLKAAFHAYEGWVKQYGPEKALPIAELTHHQLFFLGFAQVWCGGSTPEASHLLILNDPHSPAAFRVLGALSNSREFSRHFKCPLNYKMNPRKKCEVW